MLLAKIRKIFSFIDELLIVTKGTKNEHLAKVREILKSLDAANVQLNAGKCNFAVDNIEWLGFKLTRTGISPVNEKKSNESRTD